MWQEIAVGLIVALAVVYLGLRYWKTFSGRNDSRIGCSCECDRCARAPGANDECSGPEDSAP